MDAEGDKPLPDQTSVRVSVACAVVSAAVALWLTVEAVRGAAHFALVVTAGVFGVSALVFARPKRHGFDGSAIAPLLLGTPALDSSKFPAGGTTAFIAALGLAVVAMALDYLVTRPSRPVLSEPGSPDVVSVRSVFRQVIRWGTVVVLLLGALCFFNLAAFHSWASWGPPSPDPEWHQAWSHRFGILSLLCVVLTPVVVWALRPCRRHAIR